MSTQPSSADLSRADPADGADGLRFDRLLAPHLVYKRAPEQAFVSDWLWDRDAGLFKIAARLPLAHARFSDTATPHHDIVLVAEVLNQAGVIVASNLLSVPLDTQFLLHRFEVVLDPVNNSIRTSDSVRMVLSMDRQSNFKTRPDGRTTRASMSTTCTIDDKASGHCEVTGIFVSPQTYEALARGRKVGAQTPRGSAPAARESNTGRSNLTNSVITPLAGERERGYVTTVVADEDDPTFFDQPLDHLPGLLLFEAAKQSATAAICHDRGVDSDRVVISAAEFAFTRFAELHGETRCHIDVTRGVQEIGLEFEHDGRRVCQATLAAEVT